VPQAAHLVQQLVRCAADALVAISHAQHIHHHASYHALAEREESVGGVNAVHPVTVLLRSAVKAVVREHSQPLEAYGDGARALHSSKQLEA
jgi:hypothetical protein